VLRWATGRLAWHYIEPGKPVQIRHCIWVDDALRFLIGSASDPDNGPLFAEDPVDDDLASGTIYVLRSKSDHPLVAANRDVLHKIGVTGAKSRPASRTQTWTRHS
jgi:hypothetical protein